MARGGINKAIVQKAREALLARGENPSIDAVRIELGNTGSKTTIHRYLKELEQFDPRPQSSRERLSDELSALVAGLLERLMEEGAEVVNQARLTFDKQQAQLEEQLAATQSAQAALQRQFDSQHVALVAQSEELQTCQTMLQAEITRNARLSQSCADLEVRVQEKDEQIRSLEEKHRHARDALEHYRTAVKEQRDQEQRRHEGQLQQVQVELRQLQQTQVIKQDELTRLNRDNERLLSEARQQARALAAQDASMQRLTLDISTLQTLVAKADGARELLQEQVGQLREDARRSDAAMATAQDQVVELRSRLEAATLELAQLQADRAEPDDAQAV